MIEAFDSLARSDAAELAEMRDDLRRAEADIETLLSTLRLTLADAEGYLRTHGAGAEASRRIRYRCDAARAAILKVEGRTNG